MRYALGTPRGSVSEQKTKLLGRKYPPSDLNYCYKNLLAGCPKGQLSRVLPSLVVTSYYFEICF